MKKKPSKAPKKSPNKRKSSNPLRYAREALNLRVDEVAVAARCGVATIYRCERAGGYPPNRNTCIAVCNALGIAVPE